MIKLSFRDKVAYPNNPAQTSFFFTYPIDPLTPHEYIEKRETYFCKKCDSDTTIIESDGEAVCKDCGSRFSDVHFNQGNNSKSRNTGLLDFTGGGDKAEEYHKTEPIGGGSASVSWQRSSTDGYGV